MLAYIQALLSQIGLTGGIIEENKELQVEPFQALLNLAKPFADIAVRLDGFLRNNEEYPELKAFHEWLKSVVATAPSPKSDTEAPMTEKITLTIHKVIPSEGVTGFEWLTIASIVCIGYRSLSEYIPELPEPLAEQSLLDRLHQKLESETSGDTFSDDFVKLMKIVPKFQGIFIDAYSSPTQTESST